METPDIENSMDLKDHKRRPDYAQMGLGGGIVVAIMTLTPVKNWLFTREEGVALATQVAELKTTVVIQNSETTRVVERKVDKILDAISKQEERYVRDNDRQDRRLEALESSLISKAKRL